MKLGTLLSRAWGLYRKYFFLIVAITVVVWLPCNLIQNYLAQYLFGIGNTRASFQLSRFFDSFVGIIAMAGILSLLNQAAAGGSPSFGVSIQEGFEHWWRLWFARFLFSIAFVLGIILLIVPGVILLVRCSLLEAVVVRERITGVEAIKRSFVITKGYFWRLLGWFLAAFGVALLAWLPFILLTSIPASDWWIPNAVASTILCVSVSYTTVFMWVVYDEILKQLPDEGLAPVQAP